ncbi:MFS transporter [Chamaesiphon polymorphus]|uniref:MFS transporter n=1 Tax=Chamaesiphon polymorphus CCALA 037 TaxID=2107692 RepID=A0A2T1G8I9_9CYAN|nr:MFS transporter [Chamaesiphon polymorphus]PSB53565.1 MFS transporter [Chamaesiphon polymorphus CCALA 037]
MLTALRRLPPNVWLIGVISLLNDTASDLVYPLIPLYLSSVLMSGPKALGIIEGIAEATSSILKLISGVLVDRSNTIKPWIVWGYGLAGFSRPLISIANSWVGVLGIRMLDRVGKGLRSSPRDALLAASVPPERRGLAFGFHRSMDNAGAVLGPILAAVLLGYGFKVRDLFVISIIPAVLCLGMSLLIREPKNALAEVRRGKFSWNFHSLPIEFKRYLLAVVVFTLGNSSNMFLLLRARELGLPEAQVPLAWATISAIATIFGTPLSALSDRFGRIRSIAAGWLAYGLFYLSLGFLPPGNSVLLFGLFAFYGLFLAATEGVEKAIVADLAPSTMLGTAYGWFNLASGIMLLPASIIFGWLYENAGATIAFEFSACCAVVSTVLLFRVKLRAD